MTFLNFSIQSNDLKFRNYESTQFFILKKYLKHITEYITWSDINLFKYVQPF